ncbi:MAG TPA: DinB family protein [Candidatus Methylomirabilis sp.]|nr:DinB family protein [Candidatus Methylomirabilis sp.]
MLLSGGILEWKSAVLKEIWAATASAREDLYAQVQALSETQVAFRPAPDKWSIGEILDHLSLAEQSISRTLSKILQVAAGRGLIQEAEAVEAVPHRIDLDTYNQAATAPDSVRPSPGRSLEQLVSSLRGSRERLLEVARRVDGRMVTSVTIRHVQLGELDFYQWLTLEAAHESKHLAQVRRIKSHPDFPRA